MPTGPGLGVKLDRDKLGEYAELYKRLGSYPYDLDPGRPGWFTLVPNDRWADHTDARVPEILSENTFSNPKPGAGIDRNLKQRI